MILIAESGSSKTDWAIIDSGREWQFKTKGIHPFHYNGESLIEEISEQFPQSLKAENISKFYFFGPGCTKPERCTELKQTLQSVFRTASIYLGSDLLGAGIALFGAEKGIACILGTGSNSGLYADNKIIKTPLSTGYILGDEGSGAHMGLGLIKLYLHAQLPKEMNEKLESMNQLTPESVIDSIYRKPYPNRYLASFAPFIKQNIHIDLIQKVVNESFSDFFKWYILPFQEFRNLPVGFVGGIAAHFETQLLEQAQKNKIEVKQINIRPIEALKQNLNLIHR